MKAPEHLKATSLFFAGTCNLNCTYCFNPKVQAENAASNKRIIASIKDGSFITTLKSIFRQDQLKHLSLWGGEPSLNMPYLRPQLLTLFKAFTSLNSMSFSTNISTPRLAKNIMDFVSELSDISESLNRKISIRIQVSLDGPPELNDVTRLGSSALSIRQNIVDLGRFLYTTEFSKNFSFRYYGKPTFTDKSIEWFIDKENFIKYHQFFDTMYDMMDYMPSSRVLRFHFPTIATPGMFTSNDGKNFSKMLAMLYGADGYPHAEEVINCKHITRKNIGEGTSLKFDRFMRGMLRQARSSSPTEIIKIHSCSVGGSSVGTDVDGNYHLCQGSFFYTKEIEEMIAEKGFDSDFSKSVGFEFTNYESFYRDTYRVDHRNSFDTSRYAYLTKVSQRYPSLRASATLILCYELYASGQLETEFFDRPGMLDLFARYICFGSLQCASNAILAHGQPSIENPSIPRFQGNGAFRILLDKYCLYHGDLVDTAIGEKYETNI